MEMSLVDQPERVRIALSPPRRQLLERLREPGSATSLAAELGMPRQRINYHLRVLEKAGMVELVEERARRGCTERILRATADAFVVDPSVLAPPPADAFVAMADRYAAEHLVAVTADTMRNVARMQAGAERQGTRLLTFTIEAEVRFASPDDVNAFTDALTDAVARTAEAFDTPGGRPYRLIAAGHPAPATDVPAPTGGHPAPGAPTDGDRT